MLDKLWQRLDNFYTALLEAEAELGNDKPKDLIYQLDGLLSSVRDHMQAIEQAQEEAPGIAREILG